MIIKKNKILYIIGFLFFLSLFIFSSIKKYDLFTNGEYAKGIYSNGFVFLYKNDSVTEENYRAITDTKIKEKTEVYFIYNKDNGSAYILNFNRIIKEELFIFIFMILFIVLIIKNPKD